MRALLISLLLFCCLSVLAACSGKTNPKPQEITIAAAANLAPALDSLTASFTRLSGIACVKVLGSSGKLAAQIQQGAPFDVFLAADYSYPQKLQEAKHTLGTPELYASGSVVLWTNIPGLEPSMDLLTDDRIAHIALANPNLAPYGLCGSVALRRWRIRDEVWHKVVRAESVAQVNQLIASKAVEIGFTSLSSVVNPNQPISGQWSALPEDVGEPLEHYMCLLPHSTKSGTAAEQFFEFMHSPEARSILNTFGYTTPTNEPVARPY